MSTVNTTGLSIQMSKGTTPAEVIPTAITSAKPAVVTVADSTGMADGQIVTISGSDFPELDGGAFIVGALTGTEFALIGSDTTGTTGTLGATPKATYYTDATDMEILCVDAIDISTDQSSPVGIPTFCDRTAQVAGAPAGAGTWALGLWLDKDSPGYAALLDAEADGIAREFKINFPQNGYLVATGVVSDVTFDAIPLEGAVHLTATVALTAKGRHLF